MKPWYEQSFGNDYMIVYKHRDWKHAINEVQRMSTWLKLPKGANLLDIGCGMGRHALALSKLGYSVTGIDLSEALLEAAREHDQDSDVSWVGGDMRELPFESASFDATVNLFTSFGYFSCEDDNVKVLRNIRRVLHENGSFLIDFLNPEYVIRNLVNRSDRLDEESGLLIQEVRSIADGWVQKQIMISDPQMQQEPRQYLERVRLYPLDWFERQLTACGLALEQLYGDYDGSDYDSIESPRMIMTGRVRGA